VPGLSRYRERRAEGPLRRKHLRFGEGFRVAAGNRRSQAAEMVIPPGDAEGDSRNRHRGADQWLFVLSGTGRALVNGKRYRLAAGSLMLIEHGERHEVRNTGRGLLRTLNFYVPPAYKADGKPLPRGRK
jgi:mannose-6-phosphate isomerase-like protein (cupin superfamily)